MTTADDRAHGVPSVGTIPLRDPEQVFRTVSGLLRDRLKPGAAPRTARLPG